MIELFGDATGNTFRATITLEEAGLPYRPRRIDLSRGEQRDDAYLRLNATGRIPTLIDTAGPGGQPLVLTQSNAIMFYAAEKSGRLLPQDGTQRVRALEWLFLFVTDVIAPSHQGYFLRKGPEAPACEQAVRRLDERAISWYPHIDRHLAGHAYFAGEAFSLADIAAYTITAALAGQLTWDSLPNVRGWFERVRARAAVRNAMAAFRS